MFGPLEKRLLLAGLILAGAGLMIYLTARHWGGQVPPRPDLSAFAPIPAPINRAQQVATAFSWTNLTHLKPAKNFSNPFFPTPGQPQPPPPPPPPKLTQKIEVLYQGFYATSQGEKRAYVLVGDQLLVGPVGTKVVANLVIADISLRTLILKDGAGKETPLPFDVKTTLEIPL